MTAVRVEPQSGDMHHPEGLRSKMGVRREKKGEEEKGGGGNVFSCSNPVLFISMKPIRALIPFYMQDIIHFHLF